MKHIRVGFIGLGLMGNPMAKNILKNGFSLTVYNRTMSKTSELLKLGAKVASTPKAVALANDVVITMVTGPDDVAHVLFGKNGIVEGKHKGLTVIDMETIGPSAAREVATKLARQTIKFLDAPVTGSTPKAITGELTIFVGGEKRDYDFVKPVLSAMGTNIHFMGKVGSGQAIKLINNYLIAATIVALSEGMELADIVGLPREKVAEVLPSVPAMSAMMNLKIPNYVNDVYPLLFSMGNMSKDIGLADMEILKSKKTLSIFPHVLAVYKRAMDQGLTNEDFSKIRTLLGKVNKS